jgi:uncharacterized repeat protein (TIGR03837 family)
LVAEHHCRVRLIIDQPAYVWRLQASAPTTDAPFHLAGVEVLDWQQAARGGDSPQVVIAAFQCRMPALLGERLARPSFAQQPLWINLDYLSAEAWIDGAHGRPSHKSAGGTEWFYMPGFTTASGGLIRERHVAPSLPAAAAAAWAAPAATAAAAPDLAAAKGSVALAVSELPTVPALRCEALKISLFCYSGQHLSELIEHWNSPPTCGATTRPIDLLVTAGCDVADIRQHLHIDHGQVSCDRGIVRLSFLPWLSQDAYDVLLAECDLNFVRGEDSWIRAIWAGKPFVWRPYPQEDDTDRGKLDAFLQVCAPDFDDECQAALGQLMHAWRENTDVEEAWPRWLAHYPSIATGFRRFSQRMSAQQDLASRLIEFMERRLVQS